MESFFLLALIAFLAADLVSRELLNPDLYTNVLEEEEIYNRIYTELLADPAMVEGIGILTNLDLTKSAGQGILLSNQPYLGRG